MDFSFTEAAFSLLILTTQTTQILDSIGCAVTADDLRGYTTSVQDITNSHTNILINTVEPELTSKLPFNTCIKLS